MREGLTHRQRLALTATVTVLAVAVAAAWLAQWLSDPDAYRVEIVVDGETIGAFNLDSMKALPQREVRMQGQTQEGPSVLSLLEVVGVKEFERLVITGIGERDDGFIELDADEVDENVLLDFAARGTVKVCGPDVEWADRVRDVERIEVR